MPRPIARIADRIRESMVARPAGPVDVTLARAMFDALGQASPQAPRTSVEELSVAGLPAEWIVPAESDEGRVVVYVHGGAYALGSRQCYRAMLSHLAAQSRARVLSFEYRLAPEHPYPAAVHDALAVWRAVLASGTAPTRVVMAGDSAGGGLTLATLVSARDAGLALPAAAVLMSPWTDLGVTGASIQRNAATDPLIFEADIRDFAARYLDGEPAETPLASPLHADLRGLPPLLVQVASEEVLLDDAVRVVERASAAGVETTLEAVAGVFHVWQLFAGVATEADESVARIGRFIQARTS